MNASADDVDHLFNSVTDDEKATTEFPSTFSRYGDQAQGSALVLCFAFGVIGNILAVNHFFRMRRKDKSGTNQAFFNIMYIAIGITDVLICFSILPVIHMFFNARNSPFFLNHYFCVAWGLLWEILPFFSVFLVMILSISRTMTLFQPTRQLNKRLALKFIVCYPMVIAFGNIIPLFMTHTGHHHPHGTFMYNKHSGYCFVFTRESEIYWTVKSTISWILLVMPIFPILASCVLTIVKLAKSRKASIRVNAKGAAQSNATITVVIFTAAYIIYNVPVFLNYFLFALTIYAHKKYTNVYNTTLLYWYSWSFTYVVCTALNSTTNPIIYYYRMKKFRKRINIGSFVSSRYSMLTESVDRQQRSRGLV